MGYGDQKRWTADEVETLRAVYPRQGMEGAARQLRRTKGSVEYKARRLRLRVRVQAPWSPEHDAIIRAFYETRGAAYVRALVNSDAAPRTRQAVIGRAWRLGVAYRRFRKLRKPAATRPATVTQGA